ncbi:flavin monoamine oxidase family protein [Agarilytica rhodophyticola]|uniref:flavin monoamine oxidase family protein n=1 Tax=Agarilytica rhodophyticola TaxID=1737490 RepID=UPI000B34968E|nr:FAD-dependent oxidoreductase [Agarilytica rhodophyticola]
MKDVDVVIVGGGLSGLYLAYRLQQSNKSYILLEAKSRLGGRIHSKIDDHSGFAMDLGPTWFWPQQRHLLNVLSELEVQFFEQYQQGDGLYQANSDSLQRFSDMAGMQTFRLSGGVYRLIEALQARVDTAALRLSHAVEHVELNDGRWQIQTADTSFTAEHLALAVPPRIATDHIAGLQSYLSEGLFKSLIQTPTWMAAQAKFVAQYDRPFWRDEGLAGHAFSRVGPMIEIHDASAEGEQGYGLFGFIGVNAATRQNYPAQTIEAMCLRQLATLFGDKALATKSHFLQDWAKDRWVATKQDISEPSRHPECHLSPYLDELKKLNISFPVTECAKYDAGLLEGAITSADASLALIMAKA